MLYLHSLNGKTLTLPYKPDMPRWQYLAEILAPAAGYAVISGTVFERVMHKHEPWTFKNKFDRMGDVVADGDNLHTTFPLGRFNPATFGNACSNGGDASSCAVCMEPSIDMALDCLHFFHTACIQRLDRCPTCRTESKALRSAWGQPNMRSEKLPFSLPGPGPFGWADAA